MSVKSPAAHTGTLLVQADRPCVAYTSPPARKEEGLAAFWSTSPDAYCAGLGSNIHDLCSTSTLCLLGRGLGPCGSCDRESERLCCCESWAALVAPKGVSASDAACRGVDGFSYGTCCALTCVELSRHHVVCPLLGS